MSTDIHEKDPRGRKLALRFVLISGVVALFAFLAGRIDGRGFDLRITLTALLVQPLNLGAIGLIGWRLSVLSRGGVPIWNGVKAAALASTLLYVVPSRLAEFIKPVYLSASCGTGLLQGVAIVAVERFLDILIVTAILAVALALLSSSVSASALWLSGAVSIVGVAGCTLLVRCPALFNRVIALLPGRTTKGIATRLLTEIRLTVSPRTLATALLIAVAAWLLSFTMVYALLRGASVPLDLQAVLWVFLAGTIGLAVGVAPGGLGTFEAGIVVALKYQGVGTAEAINLALLIRLANLGVVPLVAAWAAAADRIGLAKLVSAAQSLRRRRDDPQ